MVNYDLPDDPENYVHRIGRTGRAGHEGHAISFATPDQRKDVKTIEKLIRATIPLSKHPEVPTEQFGADAKPSRTPFFKKRFSSKPKPKQSYGKRPQKSFFKK